jgi:hypothetical protein
MCRRHWIHPCPAPLGRHRQHRRAAAPRRARRGRRVFGPALSGGAASTRQQRKSADSARQASRHTAGRQPRGGRTAATTASDAKGALDLAQALRLGAIDTLVFKAPSRFARLRAWETSYEQITRDVTRTQTRIKALFRARGLSTQRQSVYSPYQRAQWLEKLPEPCRASAELLWQQLDAQRQLKRDAEKHVIAESHRHPINKSRGLSGATAIRRGSVTSWPPRARPRCLKTHPGRVRLDDRRCAPLKEWRRFFKRAAVAREPAALASTVALALRRVERELVRMRERRYSSVRGTREGVLTHHRRVKARAHLSDLCMCPRKT